MDETESQVHGRQITANSAAGTEALAEQIGRQLRGGEVIELTSDLGGGKTTFVRGLARGAGSADHVSSPTFTVSKVYDAGKLHIHHFDFYRLPEAGIMSQELAELLEDPANVIVAEWSDIVRDVLPSERVTINLARTASGEDERLLTLQVPAALDYLLAEVSRTA
jgi:tRNA threonylcarbamoyladenosine biosynthesis protein TsaE